MRKLLKAALFATSILVAPELASATVTTTAAITSQTANGSTTVFPYAFIIPYQSDHVTPAVTVTETTNGVVTTLTSGQYSISGIGNSGGGNVTISPAPAAGTIVTISRALNYTQPDVYQNQSFYPSTVGTSLDKLEMQIQQLKATTFSPYSNNGIWTQSQAFNGGFTATGGTITGTLNVNGSIIDSGGNITAPSFNGALGGNSSTATTLQTGRTFALSGDCTTGAPPTFNGSANITIPATCTKTNGVTFGALATSTDAANLTGTINNLRFNSDVALTDAAKTWTAKQIFENQTISALFQSRDFISPMDYPYNCAGDGVTDDTVCFQNALNASVGKMLWLGNHHYVINGSLSAPSGKVDVEGMGSGWNSVVSAQDQSSCLWNIKANTLFFTLSSGSILHNFCIMAAGNHPVAQGQITISGSVATITHASNGNFTVGDTLTYSGAPAGLTITSLGTGTGGNGTYNLSSSPGTVASPITVTAQQVINTSGHYAIALPPSAQGVTLDNLWIDGACIPIDLNGNNNHVKNITITSELGSGCMGMRVGYFTQNASTVDDKIEDMEISGVSMQAFGGTIASNPADYGIAVYDAGGLFIVNHDNLYPNIGMGIIPGTGSVGANQQVIWMFALNSALGDTTVNQGIKIDTALSSNQIKGLNFIGGWSASSTSGDEVTINNTANAQINGKPGVTDINFIGERTYNMPGNGFVIGANVGRVTITGSEICGYGIAGDTTKSGVDLKANAANLALTTSRVSPLCAGLAGSGNSAVNFEGTNNFITIEANDFNDNGAQTIFKGSGLTGNQMLISNNLPIDNNLATLSTVTSNNLDMTQGGTVGNFYPAFFITQNGAVINTGSNMGWAGRRFRLQAAAGTTFTIGTGTNSAGNFANAPITVTPFNWVDCFYNGSWATCSGSSSDQSAATTKFSYSGSTLSTQAQATTQYLGNNGGTAAYQNTAWVVPYAATWYNTVITVDTTPASGQTYTFTLGKNGAAGGSCTINNGQTSCTISSNIATVQGDLVYVTSTFSATSGSSNVHYSLQFKG